MANLPALLSVRNVVRTAGVVGLAVGIPQIVAPAFILGHVFQKRLDETTEAKERNRMLTRSIGIATVASGTKYLLLTPTRLLAKLAAAEAALTALLFGWTASDGTRFGFKDNTAKILTAFYVLAAASTYYGAESGDEELL